jgi:cytochrome P450
MLGATTAAGSAPPTLRGWPAWRCYLAFFRDQLGMLADVRRRYGPLLVLRESLPWRKNVQGVVASGAEFNRQVLTELDTYQSGGTLIRGPRGSAQNRLRRGLVAINGDEHRDKRRLVSPLFMPKATRQYYPQMVELVGRRLDTWPVGQAVDMAARVSRLSLLVSAQNLLAGEDPAEANRLAEMAANCLKHAFAPSVWLFPVHLVGTPYWRLMRRAERLEAELLQMMARRKPTSRDSAHLFDRLIGTHLAEPHRMTHEDLIGQIIFMFSASHETIAKGVVWSLFLLSQHPRIMAELHEELRAVCGDAPPSIDALEAMPLLDAVTKEAMRLLPPVPWIARRVRGETELGGAVLRPRDYVVVSIYGTHLDPDVFPRPLEFRPQRWLGLQPDGYAYLPFSAGPRTCIAKALGTTTINMMVAMILQRFRLSMVPGSRIDRTVNVTLAPKYGLPMVVARQDGDFRAAPVRGNIHQMVDLSRADARSLVRGAAMPIGRFAASANGSP